MADDADPHVQAKFFTKQKQYAIPDTPISIPIDVDREQLSAIINGALSDISEEPVAENNVQFDFLLNGEFVRTTLSKHLQDRDIASETVFDIEYVERQAAPQPQECCDHDDWVSAIQANHGFILSGSYDNTVRLWSSKGEAIMTIPGHTSPVKCVAWIRHDEDSDVSTFVTGSLDQTALVWHWQRSTNELDCRLMCRGHAASVDCVAISPDSKQMCTGSWDKMLKLWSTDCTVGGEESEETERASKKKKTTNAKPSTQTRVPVLTLSGHVEAVSAVRWMDEQRVVTSSWDQSLRLWDLHTAQQTSLIQLSKAVLDVAYSPLSRMLVTASADRHVRLVDPRCSGGETVKCAFTSHTGWVTGVDWSPTREHLFLSGSYDNVLKLWDTRSPKATLYDMDWHEDRILAVDWSMPELLLSGGVDNKLHIFSYSSAKLGTAD